METWKPENMTKIGAKLLVEPYGEGWLLTLIKGDKPGRSLMCHPTMLHEAIDELCGDINREVEFNNIKEGR